MVTPPPAPVSDAANPSPGVKTTAPTTTPRATEPDTIPAVTSLLLLIAIASDPDRMPSACAGRMKER